MQIQTRDQTISSLRTQVDARVFSRSDISPAHGDPDRLVSSSVTFTESLYQFLLFNSC